MLVGKALVEMGSDLGRRLGQLETQNKILGVDISNVEARCGSLEEIVVTEDERLGNLDNTMEEMEQKLEIEHLKILNKLQRAMQLLITRRRIIKP